MNASKNTVQDCKNATTGPSTNKYVLQLYIAGSSSRSRRAVVNVQKICQEFLQDVYVLQVIDIFQQPLQARVEQILAVPALIKKHPVPKRIFIGDMSDTETILASLDL